MAWRGLHISEPARLSCRRRQIIVDRDDDAEPIALPLEDVAWIILDTKQVTLSGGLLSALADGGVALVVPDDKHLPAGVLLPFHRHHAQSSVARLQRDTTRPLEKRMWRRIVIAKIDNQAAVLDAMAPTTARALSTMAKRVRSGDPDNLEAQAARAYWGGLFENFRRHAADRRNALLDYGYAVTRAALARACVASGLLPAFGIHHASSANPFNLVDDLLEPFRPRVDQLAKAQATERQGDELDLEDRRRMASILHSDVIIDGDTTTVLAATEAVATSFVRALEEGDAELLRTPRLAASISLEP